MNEGALAHWGTLRQKKKNGKTADPNGDAVSGIDLRSLSCWDCEFESRRGHGGLSLVIVVCCQVEVSASG